MKKILTALGNSMFNKKIKTIEGYFVLANDIKNDEELIEWLECGENVDILFVSSDIIKHYKIEEFIKIIQKLQENISIFFFEDESIKSSLKEEDNLKIFKNSEIEWDVLEKMLQKEIKKNVPKCNSKIISISGANGVREKHIFHISCKKCGS